MPRVEVDLCIAVPPEHAWPAVADVETYPVCMDSVESVVTLDHPDALHRTTQWAVRLEESVLCWTQQEVIDPVGLRFDFRQISGDLGEFTGRWSVRPAPGGRSTVSLHVDFDIGIPLLADMLNPIAADALRDNAAQMLAALERRLLPQAPAMPDAPQVPGPGEVPDAGQAPGVGQAPNTPRAPGVRGAAKGPEGHPAPGDAAAEVAR